MHSEFSEEVLKVAEIAQTDPAIVHVLFQGLKSETKVLDYLFAVNVEYQDNYGDPYGATSSFPVSTGPSFGGSFGGIQLGFPAAAVSKVPEPSAPAPVTAASKASSMEEEKSKSKEEDSKEPKPKKPEISAKPYTKLTTPAAKITSWIEVPIKELREFCDYEIKYENIKPDDIICPICRMDYYDDMLTLAPEKIEELNNLMISGKKKIGVVLFSRCKNHFYHKDCAENLVKNKKCVKCAVCSGIYGIFEGDMPKGTMNVQTSKSMHCSGYSNCGTIIINYSIPGSMRKNVRYYGTSRTAYLPDNKEGREVLALLRKAFDRKLTFTVGTSVTTGQPNAVVWSGIHHKTSLEGGTSCYGYPDPTYFSRVKEELAARGVFPDS